MAQALRAEQELAMWDGEEAPSTLRSDPPGPAPVSSAAGTFLQELASDGMDLGVRLLVLDSIAGMLPGDGENLRFFAHTKALVALREALDTVCARAVDPRVSRVLSPDAPLGAYVKGLYLRASAVARALEVFGFQALEDEGDGEAFAGALDEAAAFHFVDLRDSIQRDLATLRLELGQTPLVKSLRAAVERLFVTASHLGDARVA
jgi:hypothetical protein